MSLIRRRVMVLPKSRKMRLKVKQYGEQWFSLGFDGERTHLQTTVPVHSGGHPYETWVYPGDCDLKVIK